MDPVAAFRDITGAEEEEAKVILKQMRAEISPPIRAMAPYIRGCNPDDLHARLAELRGASDPPKPPWCSDDGCDERTRQREHDGGQGQGVQAYRCPKCHPEVVADRREREEFAASWEYANANGGRTKPTNRHPTRRGGYQPYRNPTEPNAYADYKHRPRRDQPDADYHAPL